MKWFLIFLTPFFAHLSVGQTYVPFISTADSSDQWFDFLQCGVNGGGSCLEYYRTIYSFDGDTIINGINYSSLSALEEHALEPGFFSPSPCPYSASYSTFFAGGIRESNKQVFFFDPDSISERLIYDFNLDVGDTVPDPTPIWFNPSMRTINSIDSILIDGVYRKRYNLPDLDGPHVIIEGIGSSLGLFPNIEQTISCGQGLYCYLESDVSLFPDPSFQCELNLGIESQEIIMEISPNPASDILTIQSDLGSTMDVEILNSFGQVVLKESLSELSNEMDVSQLASGIYFVKVLVDGKVGIQKVVIE